MANGHGHGAESHGSTESPPSSHGGGGGIGKAFVEALGETMNGLVAEPMADLALRSATETTEEIIVGALSGGKAVKGSGGVGSGAGSQGSSH